ncbi:hypothetical protein BT63DRAFT_57059 [Microthyrium microscopicum]|uniref:CENP-V/GFA domain-containing protein n=1 Tax=Microthyrium microscopicum TaxID=703497 RepID=A0A6A6U4Z9_9PEZI|nr:hypothetical protein BT63DRAFT_57059 [Microthyrium microscopicum]
MVSDSDLMAELVAYKKDPSKVAHIADSFKRLPFTGSCHCGRIQYLTYLQMPTESTPSDVNLPQLIAATGQQIYKCNCSTCMKLNIFHARPSNSPDDFVVLSPLTNDGAQLSDGVSKYLCGGRRNTWYFCAKCGVRCFSGRGEWEVADVELEKSLLSERMREEAIVVKEEGEKIVVRGWRPKKDTWEERMGGPSYLSVNATTIDAGQEGLDWRKWHENGWIGYVENLKGTRQMGSGPFDGGIY